MSRRRPGRSVRDSDKEAGDTATGMALQSGGSATDLNGLRNIMDSACRRRPRLARSGNKAGHRRPRLARSGNSGLPAWYCPPAPRRAGSRWVSLCQPVAVARAARRRGIEVNLDSELEPVKNEHVPPRLAAKPCP